MQQPKWIQLRRMFVNNSFQWQFFSTVIPLSVANKNRRLHFLQFQFLFLVLQNIFCSDMCVACVRLQKMVIHF